MVHKTRITGAACLVIFFVAGCGTSATPSSDSVSTEKQTVIPGGSQNLDPSHPDQVQIEPLPTLTFYVKEMSERLELT